MRWAFYEKKMKNRFVMMENSAVGTATKRRMLVQEVVRRLRNCYREMEKDEIGEVLNNSVRKCVTVDMGAR